MPDRAVVRDALAAIKRYADYEVFFDELADPAWIPFLVQEGLFTDPPEPVQEGGYVKFPLWPESRYLTRMAPLAPNDVLSVLLTMPETENVRVHEDAVDAAVAMPPASAARLVPRVVDWLQSPFQLLMAEKTGRLIVHLARGAQPEAALTVTRTLLAIDQDTNTTRRDAADRLGVPLEPVARMHEWEYGEILTTYVPTLVEVAGMRAFMLLIDLLDEAMRISRPRAEGAEDYSYIWRPAIEDNEQNHEHGIRDHLITAVRDAAVAIVSRDPASLSGVLASLESRPWKVFRRLALNVLRQFSEAVPDQVHRLLFDPDVFEDLGLFHEFWLLARAALPSLSPDDQGRFLDRLKAKYSADLADAVKEDTPQQRQEAETFARAWYYRRLSVLAESLPAPWSDEFSALQRDIGPFEHPEFISYSSGVSWVGPSSPKERSELESMPLTDLVDYLRTWEPSRDPTGDTMEGLGQTLSAMVAASPERFAPEASRFKGLDPTYVRHFLSGLNDARRNHRAVQWPGVLELSRWVIAQPRDIPGRTSRYHDLDPGWGWARKAIAELLSSGLDGSEGGFAFAQRDEVWTLIEALTADPDPTPEHEQQFGGDNIDPFTMSINTVRGEAMHTVVRYALWVRRQFEDAGEEARLTAGFSEMPEVQRVLEHHLDTGHDPSLTIRAVYGQWFAWLTLLDPEWVRRHIRDIFPQDPAEQPHFEAAWDAYVVFGGTYDSVLGLLNDEYALALDRVALSGNRRRIGDRPDHRLVEHLMIFYWRGQLALADADGLIQRFYRVGTSELRAYALAFVGRTLQGEDKPPVSEPVRLRLQALWEWRLEQAQGNPSDDAVRELAEFGWWFASSKFPADWALTQLLSTLRLIHVVEDRHLVMETLEGMAQDTPDQALEAVTLILEGLDEAYKASLWKDNAKAIIRTALASPDASIREKAIDLVHLFGAKGFRDFGELLANGTARSAPN